jgi:hypothetical protein
MSIRAEADAPVDDLVVRFDDQTAAYFQVKHQVGLTRGANTPFGKAIRQFLTAHLQAPADCSPLVLAYAKGSRPLNDLRLWCEKLRFPEEGVVSAAESDAGSALSAICADFDLDGGVEVRAFARRIYLWQTDPREGDAYAAATQRLRDAGVQHAQQGAAFDDLASRIRELARHRAGDDRSALVRLLRRRGRVQLQNGQSPLVREELLLQDYRDRTRRLGQTLSVFAVPGAVGEIPLADGDADVRVRLPLTAGENDPRERTLAAALRRRGRVVLVGGGGGGKSTALRALAAKLVLDPERNPLPLLVHWDDVKAHRGDPLGAAIANATRQLAPDDGALLERAIRQAFARGEAGLLLDGLDEVTVGAEHLAASFRDWLRTAPASTEVVIATRPSGLPAAAVFPWPTLELCEPRSPDTTVHAIITAIAAADQQDEHWIATRLGWVSNCLRRDSSLASTPLTVVLLAVLVATTDDTRTLPVARPDLLWRVLHDVMTAWEVGTRRRGEVEVGDLRGSQSMTALRRALFVLARASIVSDVTPREALKTDLVGQFGQTAPAPLQARATDAMQFWTTTGLFTASNDVLRASPRPLAEAALARQAVEEDTSIADVFRSFANRAGWDTLAMIAAKRPDVRRAWVDRTAAAGDTDELIALVDAHLDGATLSADEIAQLLYAPRLGGMFETDRDPGRVVEALLALEPPPSIVARLRRTLANSVDPVVHRTTDAALILASGAPTRAEAARLKAFFLADRPKSGTTDDGTFRVDALDSLSLEVLQDIAVWLLKRSRPDAELVVRSLDGLRIGAFPSRLGRELRKAGHADLATEVRNAGRDDRFEMPDLGDYEASTRTALRFSATLCTPVPLERTERRRLNELADFWASMDANWWQATWIERDPESLRNYQEVASVLGGFDAPVLAAQARQVLHELDDDDDADDALRDEPSARPLTRWDLVDDERETAATLVKLVGRVPHRAFHPICVALAHAPCRAYACELLLGELPSFHEYRRFQAARVALALVADIDAFATDWSTSTDVRHRQATAWVIGHLFDDRSSQAEPVALRLLDDPDRGVLAEGVGAVARMVQRGISLPPALREQLQRLRVDPRRPFVCLWCAATVSGQKSSCPSCQSGGPSYSSDLDAILGTPRSGRPVRDVLATLREAAPMRHVRRTRQRF